MDPVDIKILFTFLSILIIFVSLTGFFIVRQQTLAIIERFGKFQRIAHAGLGFRIPLVETISARINLKIQQLDVEIETKTKDDVFIHLMVSVQYHVISEKAFEAYYKLAHPEQQIQAFIFDLVRAEVPKLILDDVFSKKDDIASAVREELQDEMNGFGYQIIKTLITDIRPDEGVKRAMNEINTSQRLRMASMEKGEAEKIIRVKQAEADAEANILHGRGIAGQRTEIIEGLTNSLEEMSRQLPDIRPSDVMEMVLLVQYFDMMRDVGGSSSTNVIFVPHSPGGMADLGQQIRETIFASSALEKTEQRKNRSHKNPPPKGRPGSRPSPNVSM